MPYYTRPGMNRAGAAEFSVEYFDRLAQLEARHPWTRAMRALTLALLARPLDRVLDAGCGTGGFLVEWTEHGSVRQPVGVDLHPAALACARRRAAGCWVAASASALPFRPDSFDAIHSADVLQHMSVAGAERALDLMASVLKIGGWLALRLRARRLLRNTPRVDYSHDFTVRGLRTALEARGFEVVFLSHVNALPSLWAELTPTPDQGPVKGIEPHDPDSLRSRLLTAYLKLERSWLLATRIPLPFGHTLVCVARKTASRSS